MERAPTSDAVRGRKVALSAIAALGVADLLVAVLVARGEARGHAIPAPGSASSRSP